MGSDIRFNDTLKLSRDRGFPKELTLEAHVQDPNSSFDKIKGKQFPFTRTGNRLFHIPPTRVFLVEEIDGKWLYWGHAMIKEQTIREGTTSGLYEPEYQRLATINEAPRGKSYFERK